LAAMLLVGAMLLADESSRAMLASARVSCCLAGPVNCEKGCWKTATIVKAVCLNPWRLKMKLTNQQYNSLLPSVL